MGDWGYFVVLIVTVGVAILGTYGATKDYYYRVFSLPIRN